MSNEIEPCEMLKPILKVYPIQVAVSPLSGHIAKLHRAEFVGQMGEVFARIDAYLNQGEETFAILNTFPGCPEELKDNLSNKELGLSFVGLGHIDNVLWGKES